MAGRSEQIFRKVALDRLASPEQLDLLMEVTSPRSWIALLALALLLATATVWGFAGSIPTQVEGQGVLIKSGGVSDIFAQGSGPVKEVLIKEGDVVTEGQVVARIEQPELETRIANAKAQLAEQRRQHERLMSSNKRDLGLLQDSNELQKASLEDTIKFSEGRLKALQDQLQNEEQLLEKGLITRTQVLNTRQSIFSTQDQLERSRSSLKQLNITDVSTRTQKEDELIRSQLSLNDAERQIAATEEQLRLQAEVLSPYSGRILEVKIDAGNLISRGGSIASLQEAGDSQSGLEAVIYIPAKDGKYVENGMDVQISPLSAPREEYGYLVGKSVYVSEFPATRQGMVRLLSNDQLVQTLSVEGAPFAVYAQLTPKPGTEAGYAWSSPKGEALKVNSGMICRVTITVESRRPIDLVIPTLREKLGI
jgi:HlyD family secretion protein